MLNKNSLAVKKVQGQSEAMVMRPKTLISSTAKKLNILFNLNEFTGHLHNYDWLCHLATLYILDIRVFGRL